MRTSPTRFLAALGCAAVVLLAGCGSDDTSSPIAGGEPIEVPDDVRRLVPRIIRELPHDPSAFTQGLELDGDALIESTGQYGRSTVRRVAIDDGTVLESTAVDPALFAEGITRVDGGWLQLTWQEHVALRWDDDLSLVERIDVPYEGWGLSAHADGLVHTDGSSQLRLLDPDDLSLRTQVTVTLGGEPVDQLNELECVGDTVWANVWHTTTILGIDLASGAVTDVVDASELVDGVEVLHPAEDVLNGIAHDAAAGTYYLTGKRWPSVFEVELVPADVA